MNQDAVVLFSGGQDSTTCLYWAKKKFKKVYAVSFYYEQKHAQEINQARLIAEKAEVEFHVVDLSFLGKMTNNSLTNQELVVDSEKPEGGLPNSFVPGRNLLFLNVAAIFAYERKAQHLVTGVSQTDFSGYPDCRDSFIKSMNVTLNLAMEEQFIIHTPLMWIDKAQTWALADELGVMELVRQETLTCYNAVLGDGCGNCPACSLRKEGLLKYLSTKE